MGWVVKQWRTDVARDRAERDARRARRAADRAAASVAAQTEALDALERLATELLVTVGRQRTIEHEATGPADAAVSARPDEEPPSGAAAPDLPGAPDDTPSPLRPQPQPAPRAPRRRTDRASLRASPLGELFRATGPGPAGGSQPPA